MRISDGSSDVCSSDLMGLVILGLVQQLPFLRAVAGRAGGVDLAEDHAQLARIGLAEEGVKFLDQRGNTGLFMHRLVRQRPKLRPQRGDHPARQVKIPAFGGAEMHLAGAHLLLADKAVQAAQRRGGVRSEERRAGKECVSTCRYGWEDVQYKKKKTKRIS